MEIIINSNSSKFDENGYSEISEEDNIEISRIGSLYYGLINEIVNALVRENESEVNFYSRLFENIFRSDLFPKTEYEQGILLFFLARRIPQLPYFQAKSNMEITSDDIDDFVKKHDNILNKVASMLNGRFLSPKEESVQLCDIASDLEKDKEIIIFWAYVLSYVHRRDNKDTNDSE